MHYFALNVFLMICLCSSAKQLLSMGSTMKCSAGTQALRVLILKENILCVCDLLFADNLFDSNKQCSCSCSFIVKIVDTEKIAAQW